MDDFSVRQVLKGEDPLSDLGGKNVFIRSFGCALNHADGLRMEELIRNHGAIITEEKEADAVVVNTCTVVKRTEREVLRFLRSHVDKEILVMGCMAAIQSDEIRSVCYSRFLPPYLLDSSEVSLGGKVNEVTGLVPIARGCRGECTYCVARRARGRLQSELPYNICWAVRDLAAAGVREIRVTAQDVSSWGMDYHENLSDLVRQMLALPGRFRLRLGMMNPATLIPIVDEMVAFYRHERMYAFAHVPVQSGSDQVLSLMKREYSAQDFLDLIQVLREGVPDIWIATDVITGFPGETEAHFKETLDLIEKVRPNKVNVTRYSSRPGTAAAAFPDVLERTKKERSRSISRLADHICVENNRSWIGKIVPVVAVEQIKPGTVVCRTPSYRSIVIREDLPLGFEGFVRITGAKIHYFTGTRAD
jgi:threonylcarbamoyladenosine tRNA methylthiotransferase CDKAL1